MSTHNMLSSNDIMWILLPYLGMVNSLIVQMFRRYMTQHIMLRKALDKKAIQINSFLISPRKHMSWILIEIASVRQCQNNYMKYVFMEKYEKISILLG